MHALRPLQARDPDRVRRGAAGRRDHVRRRAAGRPGGPCRPAVRRPRGAACSMPRSRRPGSTGATVYVTNAVKHFKFVPRGKRRIHNKPDAGEIEACRWWIEHERELIRPPVTVALGATAARSLIGKVVTIGKVRGAPLTLADGSECWVTVHPSSLLRMPDEARAARASAVPARPEADQGAGGGVGALTVIASEAKQSSGARCVASLLAMTNVRTDSRASP